MAAVAVVAVAVVATVATGGAAMAIIGPALIGAAIGAVSAAATTKGSLEDKLKAAAIGAIVGLVCGAVLGPASGFISDAIMGGSSSVLTDVIDKLSKGETINLLGEIGNFAEGALLGAVTGGLMRGALKVAGKALKSASSFIKNTVKDMKDKFIPAAEKAVKDVSQLIKDTSESMKGRLGRVEVAMSTNGTASLKRMPTDFGGLKQDAVNFMERLKETGNNFVDDVKSGVKEVGNDAEKELNFFEDLKPNQSQLNEIGKVKNPKTDLINSEHPYDYTAKGNYGEMKVDVDLESTGRYKRISDDRVTSLDTPSHHGIDGIYANANPPPKYMILDSKFLSSDSSISIDKAPHLSNTKSGRQLSDKWILKNLEDAVGDEDIVDKITSQLKSNPSNIQRVVSKVDNTGNITHYYVDSLGKVIKNADGSYKIWMP